MRVQLPAGFLLRLLAVLPLVIPFALKGQAPDKKDDIQRPRIALVLSGAAGGAVHVGVLKVLEENRIPVDLIAGTSFFPFGAAVSTAGEVSGHATYDGNETPSSEEVIAGLVQAFQADARTGAIRATGICYDGRIVQDGRKIDAVIIGLEHVSGCASKTCVSYSRNLFGKYRFGNLVASLDEPTVFVTT